MPDRNSARVMVIGLDGMMKTMIERFADEGAIPNIARLMRRGTLSRMIPAIPAQTPTNWATLATGAYPGTHEIVVWGTHEPGKQLDEHFADEAMSSNLCRAEYFWEAASRQGLSSLLVNYVGYPPTCGRTTFIEWAQGPTAYHFQISPPGAYKRPKPKGKCESIDFRRASGWTGLPKSKKPPLEAEITVKPVRSENTTYFHLALVAAKSKGYDTVLVSPSRDARRAVKCTKGGWSAWLEAPFHVGSKKVEGAVRFKLIDISPTARRFWLYRSQIYPLAEFTYPPALGGELTQNIGPFIHEAAWQARHVWNLCDDATCEEELLYHARWIGKAVKYLWNRLDVRLYYQHMHLLDTLNHHYLATVDPTSPAYGRIPPKAGWAAMRQGYRAVDAMVGEVTKAAGTDTLIAVCSDHGDVPNRRAVSLLNFFRKRGWLHLKKAPDGKPEIDFARTRLFVVGCHLWINLKGRDPAGCVAPAEYEDFRREVINALLDFKDPENGKRVIGLALTREDAAAFGMYGPASGDIVFYYSQHYRWTGAEVFRMGIKDLVWDDPGGANHGCQPPGCRTEVSDNAGALVLAGPGVRKGYTRDAETTPPMFTADLVPTLAHLSGIDGPRHVEGKVVHDLITGYKGRMKRRHRRFGPLPARPKASGKLQLAGDVTDEE